MQRPSLSPVQIAVAGWCHRQLIVQMARREALGRYRGSLLGIVWSFFNPLLMLAVYTYVFSVVFKARWDTGSDSRTEFAIVLFAGMIVFNVFAECINRAPWLILGNTSYVKKVVFPLEILPWTTLAAALFHAAVSLGVLLLFCAAVGREFHWTAIFLPAVLLPLVLLILGLSWLLSSLGVYIRDIGQSIGLVTTVLMFLSPLFYPVSVLPPGLRSWAMLNPLAFAIEQTRLVLLWGGMPDWQLLAGHLAGAALLAWLGFAWFQKTRRGFADVL